MGNEPDGDWRWVTRPETTDMIAPILNMINIFQTQELSQVIEKCLKLFLRFTLKPINYCQARLHDGYKLINQFLTNCHGTENQCSSYYIAIVIVINYTSKLMQLSAVYFVLIKTHTVHIL